MSVRPCVHARGEYVIPPERVAGRLNTSQPPERVAGMQLQAVAACCLRLLAAPRTHLVLHEPPLALPCCHGLWPCVYACYACVSRPAPRRTRAPLVGPRQELLWTVSLLTDSAEGGAAAVPGMAGGLNVEAAQGLVPLLFLYSLPHHASHSHLAALAIRCASRRAAGAVLYSSAAVAVQLLRRCGCGLLPLATAGGQAYESSAADWFGGGEPCSSREVTQNAAPCLGV